MASSVHQPVESVKEDISVLNRLRAFLKGLIRSVIAFIGIFFKALSRNRSGMAGFIGLAFIMLMSTVGAYFIDFDDEPKLDQIGAPPGSRVQLITQSENANQFNTLEDLTGHTLGYIQRSGGEILLEPYLEQDEPPFEPEEFRFQSGRGIPVAIEALANGEIDALVLFSESVEQYITDNRDAAQGEQFANLVVSNSQLGAVHLLGTDTQGRDIFSHIVNGGWKLIRVGLMAGFLSTMIAVTLGSLAALLGGPIDRVLVSIANFVLTIPQFPLLVVLAALIGQQLSNWFLLSLLIAVLSWPVLMRAIRAQVLSLREREYVEAAISLGLGVRHIVFYEILPNMMSFVAINFIFAVIGAMYQQIGLIFLGMAAIND